MSQGCKGLTRPTPLIYILTGFSLVQFSHSVVSNSLQPHGLQHARFSHPSPTPKVCSNPRPLSRWCHPTISSSVIPFSSCLQPFPASGSFPVSQFFASGGQNIRVSALASVFPMNIQDWFPLGLTGWIFLQSEGLSRVFSNTTVQKYQFFGSQLSFYRELKRLCAPLSMINWDYFLFSPLQTIMAEQNLQR